MDPQPQFSSLKTRDNTFPVNVTVSAAIVTHFLNAFIHVQSLIPGMLIIPILHEKKQTDFCESILKKKIFYRLIYYLIFLIYCCYVRKLKDFLFMDNTHFKNQSSPPFQFSISMVSHSLGRHSCCASNVYRRRDTCNVLFCCHASSKA